MTQSLTHCSASPGTRDVSVVLVSWNAKGVLRQCLRSVYDTIREATLEVWVIDNNSFDGSPEMVQKEFPKVNLLCTGDNLGFSKANNIGINKSNARYICFINSDVIVLEDCIDLLFRYMDQHPKTGMVGPKILNPDMTLQPSCFALPTPRNIIPFIFGLSRLFPNSRLLGGFAGRYRPYDTIRNVEMLSGCFWMARAIAIQDVGPLDESYFMYMEDFDWCARFWKAGWPIVYYSEAGAIHYKSGSSVNEPIKNCVERRRSQIHYWKKHHGARGAEYVAVMESIRELLRLIQYAFIYLFKSSRRNGLLQMMRESVASVWWLLFGRRVRRGP